MILKFLVDHQFIMNNQLIYVVGLPPWPFWLVTMPLIFYADRSNKVVEYKHVNILLPNLKTSWLRLFLIANDEVGYVCHSLPHQRHIVKIKLQSTSNSHIHPIIIIILFNKTQFINFALCWCSDYHL